jgi:hypothetical protein
MPLGFPPLRIGLAASARHRAIPDGALFRLLAPLERTIREELRAELLILGQTYDALNAAKVLDAYPRLTRLAARHDGGLIHLVAAVVSGDPGRRLDAVVYLLDPDDPTTLFPEGVAVKRECVIHETLFISTLAHAREWFELARVECGFAPNPLLDTQFDFGSQTIALIAHDARKDEMIEFVRRQFAFFDRFRRRIATGTTGELLNDLAATLSPSHLPWCAGSTPARWGATPRSRWKFSRTAAGGRSFWRIRTSRGNTRRTSGCSSVRRGSRPSARCASATAAAQKPGWRAVNGGGSSGARIRHR